MMAAAGPAEACRPLRVLYVNHVTEISGAEKSLLALLAALDRSKVTPLAAVPELHGPLSLQLQPLVEGPHEIPLRRLHRTSNLLTNLQEVLALRRARGVLGRLCRSQAVDIVHANSFHAALGCVINAGPLPPVIWHVRDVMMPPALVRLIAGRCRRMIAISGAVARYLTEVAPQYAGKVVLVHNGIDVKSLSVTCPPQVVRAQLGVPEGAPLVVCVGQLVPWKRQDLFIEAAQLVARHWPQAQFAIVGADMFGEHAEYVGKLKQAAANGQAQVRFLGYRQDVPDIIAAADILAHPATAEPLGRVILEAMALGTPAVAANAGGPAELLIDAESGLLVEPADTQALADGIMWVLENPDYGVQLAKEARGHVVANFSVVSMARKIEALYDGMLRG